MPRYPLASTTWGDQEILAIQEVLQSGQLTYGTKVREFEQSFASIVGSKDAVMVNSGSSANLLALAVAKEFFGYTESKNEVIVPGIGWATSYFPISQLGYRLVVVDVVLPRLEIDVEQVRASIGPNTAGILNVDILGTSAASAELRRIADDAGIFFIEDACESMLSEFEGRKAGRHGHLGTFSTYFSHHISTIEGGLIVSDSQELLDFTRSMRSHGWAREVPLQNLGWFEEVKADQEPFTFILPGYNFRPTEIQGAAGIPQLIKLPEFVAQRSKNGAYLQQSWGEMTDWNLQHHHKGSSWFGFAIWPSAGRDLNRLQLHQELLASGIESRPVIGGAIHLQPVWNRLNARLAGPLTNAEHIHRNGLMLGNHHYEISEQIDEALDIVFRH